ncbi:MAG: hypothetical protein IPK00_18220 [Deltaproteobacteria bacterium]|nr:hypothetical protein [Deltaproteobacteria bacterium]
MPTTRPAKGSAALAKNLPLRIFIQATRADGTVNPATSGTTIWTSPASGGEMDAEWSA